MSPNLSSPGLCSRNLEVKLFQTCLDACIDGIGRIPVDKRRRLSATLHPNNNTSSEDPPHGETQRAVTPHVKLLSNTALQLPPLADTECIITRRITSPVTNMNRSKWSGTPPHGAPLGPTPTASPSASPAWGSQDARSNVAIQPSAQAGNFKLKKNTVKIVSATGASTTTPSSIGAPVLSLTTSPAPGLIKAESKEADGLALANIAPVPAATPAPAPRPVSPKIEIPKFPDAAELALDIMFARLTTQSSSPSLPTETALLSGPEKDIFSFETRLDSAASRSKGSQDYKLGLSDSHVKSKGETKVSSPAVASTTVRLRDENQSQGSTAVKKQETSSLEELENKYMRKATQYINVLPDSQGTAAHDFKIIMKKLHTSYAPESRINVEKNELLKARYAFAIVTFINQKLNKRPKPLKTDVIKKMLKDNDGNFLSLCATLVEQGYIALGNMDEIVGLCQAILNILPVAGSAAPVSSIGLVASTATVTNVISPAPSVKPTAKDPVDGMEVWPTQKKRTNLALYRTCVLRGVSGITSINQLQALVWGGRLESLTMQAGSDTALVRFLEPAACQKYLAATENGIEIAGVKKAVIFVEIGEGPNSINDVIRNCIDSGASRCVRAVGASERWSDKQLLDFARGNELNRELDCTKRGKNARGHDIVDFRFANIYHAINFKSQVRHEVDWEHCNITYGQDPCETARGVHFKDEIEGGTVVA